MVKNNAGRSIFYEKRRRLRTRRILIVSITILLVVSLIVGLFFWLRGDEEQKPLQTPPNLFYVIF